MKDHQRLKQNRQIGYSIAVILLIIAMAILSACSRSPFPGEQEEIPTKTEDVPARVLAAAVEFCERIGGAQYNEWFWDTEDNVWECTQVGLPRRAELDIAPDGSFSELELVYDFSEVELTLSEVARFIRTKCRTESDTIIELSFRREVYLDDIPELKEAWSLSGIVLEFQCPNGRDFEIDTRGMIITRPVDDKTDPSNDKVLPQ